MASCGAEPTGILGQPDETLLHTFRCIGAMDPSAKPVETLQNVALTCRRFGDIAQEALVERGKVHLDRIWHLVDLLLIKPVLAYQLYNLTLYLDRTDSVGTTAWVRYVNVQDLAADLPQARLLAMDRAYGPLDGPCIGKILKSHQTDEDGYCLLVALAANLTSLRLFYSEMSYPPLFRNLFRLDRMIGRIQVLGEQEPIASSQCLAILSKKVQRIEILPQERASQLQYEWQSHSLLKFWPRFDQFSKLRELSVKTEMLGIESDDLSQPITEKLPKSLEKLRLLVDPRLDNFEALDDLLDKEKFPNLKCVEMEALCNLGKGKCYYPTHLKHFVVEGVHREISALAFQRWMRSHISFSMAIRAESTGLIRDKKTIEEVLEDLKRVIKDVSGPERLKSLKLTEN